MSLRLVTVSLARANAFVAEHHRHHDPVVGHKFSVGCWDTKAARLVGVAIASRPVARRIDFRRVVEVVRLCTDGTRNACSFLYAACARAAAALGFDAIITYTLDAEQGASLRALCWWEERSATPGRSWDTPSRHRDRERAGDNLGPKTRWLKLLGDFSAPPQLELTKEKAQMEFDMDAA